MCVFLKELKEVNMFIQPITATNFSNATMQQKRNTSFKGVEELDPYMNYRGPAPSAIEQEKYKLSFEAVYHEGKGDYAKAAEAKIKNAQICLQQGLKEDAEKLMNTAKEYLGKIHR